MGPSLRVFRGLLGHAVLVKSCAIETSAAAISRILAPIGGNFSPPRSDSWLVRATVSPPHSSSLRLFRHAIDTRSDSTITNGYSNVGGSKCFVVVCSRDDRLVLNMGQLKVGNPLEAFRRQGS